MASKGTKPKPEAAEKSAAANFGHPKAVLPKSWEDWFEPYPEDVKAASKRLLTDARMKSLWQDGFSEKIFHYAVMHFDHATARDAWANLSKRARDRWLEKFEKAVDSLLDLMEKGPRTPTEWGFPVRDYALLNVAYRMGVSLPAESDTSAFFSKMLELQRCADADNWTIADALKHYRDQQRVDCQAPQVLKKPGEAMAARAEFIYWFHKTGISAAKVATVAAVLFNDNSIDDRQVRRLTRRTSR
jgi:hypothetical protein